MDKEKSLQSFTVQFLSKPSPPLVFIILMIILNMDFWIIVFSSSNLTAKSLYLKLYYKDFSMLCLTYKFIMAGIASVIYPSFINFISGFSSLFSYLIKSWLPAEDKKFEIQRKELEQSKQKIETLEQAKSVLEKEKESLTIKEKDYDRMKNVNDKCASLVTAMLDNCIRSQSLNYIIFSTKLGDVSFNTLKYLIHKTEDQRPNNYLVQYNYTYKLLKNFFDFEIFKDYTEQQLNTMQNGSQLDNTQAEKTITNIILKEIEGREKTFIDDYLENKYTDFPKTTTILQFSTQKLEIWDKIKPNIIAKISDYTDKINAVGEKIKS